MYLEIISGKRLLSRNRLQRYNFFLNYTRVYAFLSAKICASENFLVPLRPQMNKYLGDSNLLTI